MANPKDERGIQLASKKKTLLSEMTEEEVINTMRETREEIWLENHKNSM